MASQKKNKKSLKKASNKFAEQYFKFLPYLLATLPSVFLAVFVYDLSFFIHEGGHIAYATFDNLILYGEIPKIIISNWFTPPIFTFLLVNQ